MIVQRFNLNLIPNQSPVIVHVNQYDTGTGRLIATLYEGNEPYSPNGTAVIQGTKPDGHGFQYTATLDGNVVTADLTEQMAPVAGDVRTQIVVTESSGVTGTFAFIIRVQPSALPSDTDMSESDYQYIEEAIREAQEAVETAQEATETAQEAVERAQEAITETQENAEDSEAWAQGTRGGIPVEPTDPTYEHNAEYWAQYSERYAQGGLHYKASIPFVDIPTTGMREGDMYDITDDFTTDSRFTEGAGIEVKGGTNIAWNSDNKWDILALPYIPKTTFNGRSGSILPMAGDYDSKKILLSSALHIRGETQSDVQEALEALSDDGVKSFNGRSGSVLPMAGDYDSEKILLASVLHIGGETQENAQEALEALENNKAEKVDNAIEDNFAGLDANGNLKDSGKKASDFATPSDIAGQQSLLKDTVGWTGKNLLKNTATTQTINGVTFTVNADGSVTVNGTGTNQSAGVKELNQHFTLPAGNYILSGSPHNVYSETGLRLQIYNWTDSELVVYCETDEDVPFSIGENKDIAVRIWFPKTPSTGGSNITFYPMIRHADITDPTYEPYHESVEEEIEQIYADNGVLGAKNLLNHKRSGSTTIQGITYTVNADLSISTSGTADANNNSWWNLLPNGITLPAGKYIISDNGNLNTPSHRLSIRLTDNTYVALGTSSETEVTLTAANQIVEFSIGIAKGQASNNYVFKPMIRLASDPDDTYQPHAMTNRELTEEVSNITNTSFTNVTAQPNTITSLGSFTLSKGKYIVTAIVSMSKQTSDFDISISFSSSATAFGNSRYDTFNGKAPLAASGGIQATKMFNVSSDTKVYIVANHNHSSELALYPAVSIAKI